MVEIRVVEAELGIQQNTSAMRSATAEEVLTAAERSNWAQQPRIVTDGWGALVVPNDPDAVYEYRASLTWPDGVARDYGRAARLYRTAAEAGQSAARLHLARGLFHRAIVQSGSARTDLAEVGDPAVVGSVVV